MKYLATLGLLAVLFIAGCKTINKDALATWTSGDLAMMQDLEAYRAAQSKPIEDIVAHLKLPIGSITAAEEQGFMAELLADVSSDPKLSANRKASYPIRITAHLNLFHSLQGN